MFSANYYFSKLHIMILIHFIRFKNMASLVSSLNMSSLNSTISDATTGLSGASTSTLSGMFSKVGSSFVEEKFARKFRVNGCERKFWYTTWCWRNFERKWHRNAGRMPSKFAFQRFQSPISNFVIGFSEPGVWKFDAKNRKRPNPDN